jgi:hypothetical protein
MAIATMFRLTQIPSTGNERMFGKSNGSSGWSMYLNSAGRLQVTSAGVANLFYAFTADDVGKTFIALWTRNASTAELWLYSAGWAGPRLAWADTDGVGAPATTSWGTYIGVMQNGTTQTSNTDITESADIIGCGYSSQYLNEAQVTTFMAACVSEGTLHAGASFPGAVSVYQAANGLENDQVGANDMVRVENGGPLTDVTFAPAYPGSELDVYVTWGQSNRRGAQDSSDFADVAGVDYTVAVPGVRYAFEPSTVLGPLDDSNATTGTASEVSLGRALLDAGRSPVILKHGAGGTTLYEDWDPDDPGIEWSNGVNHFYDTIPMLDKGVIRCMSWAQGESDAAIGEEANSLAYETNLDNLFTKYRTEFADYLHPDFRFLLIRLNPADGAQDSSAYPYIDNIRTAQEAVAASRSDVLIIDMDLAVTTDGIHWDAAGLVGMGFAESRAILNDSDAVAYNGIDIQAPEIDGVPTITGTPTVGQTVTVTPAEAVGAPIPTNALQLYRDGVAISGASGTEAFDYVPIEADEDAILTAVQVSTNSEGSDSATSAGFGPIEAASTWTPGDFTNIRAYWRADDISQSGTNLVQFNDQIGSQHLPVWPGQTPQVVSDPAHFNGEQHVLFDGTQLCFMNNLDIVSDDVFTFFWIAKLVSSPNGARPMCFNGVGFKPRMLGTTLNRVYMDVPEGGGSIATQTLNERGIILAWENGVETKSYRGGTLEDSDASTAAKATLSTVADFSLGGYINNSAHAHVRIVEAGILGAMPTPSELTEWNNYLARYGAQV